jgi:hypothetical protein
MNPKRMIIVSTMAFAITIGAGIWNNETCAHVHFIKLSSTDTYTLPDMTKVVLEPAAVHDDLHQALGVSSDEEIHDALYNGSSLASIAQDNQRDVQKVIDLQVAELNDQLVQNLAKGNLSKEAYLTQKSELVDIITKSVYGNT